MAVTTNNGFKNMVYFPFIRDGSDGFPVIGAGILLGKADEINNKALSLENTTQTASIEADNEVEEQNTVINKKGTLTVYNISLDAFCRIFGYTPDDNGNIIDNPNITKRGVLFFETQKSDGTKIQHWIYKVVLSAPADAAASFNGSNVAELEIPVIAYPITINSALRFKASVYSTNTGFVSSGLPTALYKPTFEAAVATPTADPAAGAVASGTDVSLACATPGALIYYTDDGSTPSEASTPYTVPIEITAGVTIKAKAYVNGRTASSELSAVYTIAT